MDHSPNITALPDGIDPEGILGNMTLTARRIVLHVPRARLVELLNEAIGNCERAIETHENNIRSAGSSRREAIAAAADAVASHLRHQRRLLQLTVELLPQDEIVYEITPDQLSLLIGHPWEVPSAGFGHRPHYGCNVPR